MCAQDIQIGQASNGTINSVSVGTSAVLLVYPAANRLQVTISPPTANRITISDKPTVIDGAGLVLAAGDLPIMFHIKDYGSLVQKGLYAIANTGTNTVGIAETFVDLQAFLNS